MVSGQDVPIVFYLWRGGVVGRMDGLWDGGLEESTR